MADLVTFGEATLRLSPARGKRLATASRFDSFVGGPTVEVAATAAQLGTDAAWLSTLPDSPLGRRVVRELGSHGVRTGIAWTDPAATRLGTRYRERGDAPGRAEVRDERAGVAVGRVDPDELPLDAVRDARALGVSGVTPALSERAREATARVLEVATAADTRTVFDARYRSTLWSHGQARETFEALFPAVDVLVVDRADAVSVLDASDRPVELAHGLATDHGFSTVLVTLTDGGVLGLHDGEVHERAAVDVETVDPVGERGAFVGGFLTARLDGEPTPAALDRGVAAAALARTVDGDLPVATRDEVAELATRDAEGG